MTKNAAPAAAPGDREALRARLWDAVEAAHALLRSRKPDVKLRAVHATSQAASAYAKLLDDGDLEARLEALEARAVELAEEARRDSLPVFGEEPS
jgi:hypothetical protein